MEMAKMAEVVSWEWVYNQVSSLCKVLSMITFKSPSLQNFVCPYSNV